MTSISSVQAKVTSSTAPAPRTRHPTARATDERPMATTTAVITGAEVKEIRRTSTGVRSVWRNAQGQAQVTQLWAEHEIERKPERRCHHGDPPPAPEHRKRAHPDEAGAVADLHEQERRQPEHESQVAGAVEGNIAEPREDHAHDEEARRHRSPCDDYPRQQQEEEQGSAPGAEDALHDGVADDTGECDDGVPDEQGARDHGTAVRHIRLRSGQ